MPLANHKDLTGIDVHTPFSFVYADETARTAATGFVESDKYKWAVQESDNTFWMLTDHTTPTWKQMGV